MLVVAPALVGFKSEQHDHTAVGSLGILETLWLARAGDKISAVAKPSTTLLRKAGMSMPALSRRHKRFVNKEFT